jgi:intracellular septation protein A
MNQHMNNTNLTCTCLLSLASFGLLVVSVAPILVAYWMDREVQLVSYILCILLGSMALYLAFKLKSGGGRV